MSIFNRHYFALLAASLLFAGCSRSAHVTHTSALDTKPEGARLSTAEVIRIAKQAATRQGADLRRYKEPEALYEFTRKDKSWWVSFDGRVAMFGNHFSVSVDDQTGETRVMRGK